LDERRWTTDKRREIFMAIIELEHASKSYKIGEVTTTALNDVSLDIEAGEFTALVGPSGSGKTTLLQLMGCLDRPNRGAVLINGQDVTKLSNNRRADLRRDVIGFIFQFFALVPVLSAYENVELPLLLANVNGSERRTRVLGLLDAVGLSDRIHHRPRPDERRRAAARGHRPARWRRARSWCWPTSRRPTSTPPTANRQWRSCTASTRRRAPRLSSPPMTRG
jgi:predicted ABC-type transport system involved in lysophospholipase L1 biosynthesis ATPase subunit